jgi:hypothetical protein
VLNRKTKYVVSRTLTEPLPWQNSALVTGEVGDAVAKLKAGRRSPAAAARSR